MSGTLTLAHTEDRWTLSGKNVRVGRSERESAFDVAWQEAPTGLLNMRVHCQLSAR